MVVVPESGTLLLQEMENGNHESHTLDHFGG